MPWRHLAVRVQWAWWYLCQRYASGRLMASFLQVMHRVQADQTVSKRVWMGAAEAVVHAEFPGCHSEHMQVTVLCSLLDSP